MASEKVSFDASKSQGNSSPEIPATTKSNMGTEPSNLGTSSFNIWGLTGCVFGIGMAEEEEGVGE